MKIVRLIALLATMSWLFPFASAKTLKVGMVEWVAFAPLNVAQAKGFWPGLDVTVTVYGANTELNEALVSGEVDVALDMMGSWLGLEQSGVPLVLLGETDWSNGGDKIILRDGLSVADLRGKGVGVYLAQPSVTFFLNEFLVANKLSFADVHMVELDPAVLSDKFIAGQLPLIVNYDPQAVRAEKAGGKVVATSATFPGCIPEGFVALKATLDSVPAADWVTFFRGWHHAVKWSADPANWTEFRQVLCAKTFRGTEYSDEDLRAMLANVRIFAAPEAATRNGPGGEVERYLDRMKVFLLKMGALKHPYTSGTLLQSGHFCAAAKLESM